MYARLKIQLELIATGPAEREGIQELSLTWDRAKTSPFPIINIACVKAIKLYLEQKCELLWICPRPARYEHHIVNVVSVAGAGNLQRLQVRGQAYFKLTKCMLSLAYSSSQTLPYIHFQVIINWALKTRFSLRSKSWIIGTPQGIRLLNFCIRIIWNVLHAVFRSASLSKEWDVKWVLRAQEKAEGVFLHLTEMHSINPAYTIACQCVTNTQTNQSITQPSARH